MDNFDTSSQEPKRGRGRPPLSPEEKEQRQGEYTKRSNEAHKKSNYAAKKKYFAANPDKVKEWRGNYYEPKVRIHKDFVPEFQALIASTDFSSITDFFISAVEEKYNIILSKK